MDGRSLRAAGSDEQRYQALEAEIRELAAHLAAGTCRIIELIGEFDRCEGYAWHGLSSTAHWLSWQCGTSLHTAREQLRVARALAGLPLVRAVFQEGGLSFSKVRAITRVATPDNEEVLVETARFATATQLERLLSACRRAGLGFEQMQRHARRCLRWAEDEDGMLRLHARLPVEEGALVIKALEAAADRIVEEKRGSVPAQTSGYSDGLSPEAAAQRYALDPDDVPAETWAGWRAENPYERRYADALCRVAEGNLACSTGTLAGAERYLLHVHVRASDLRTGEAELDGGGRLCAATLRRIACDASLLSVLEDAAGTPLDLGRRRRSLSVALRRALVQRDGGCRFPGCRRRRWVDAHHVRHWIEGGETRPDNLILLCRYHHRLIHEGGYAVIRTAGDFVFRTPAGELIERHRPPRGDFEELRFQQRALAIDATTIFEHGCGERMNHHAQAAVLFERTYPPSGVPPTPKH